MGSLPLLRMELLSKAIIGYKDILAECLLVWFLFYLILFQHLLLKGSKPSLLLLQGRYWHAPEHSLHPLSWLSMDWICWDRLASPFQVDPRLLMKLYHISHPEHIIKQVGAKLCPGGGGWFHLGLPFWAVCSNSVFIQEILHAGTLGHCHSCNQKCVCSQMSCWFLLSILFLLRILEGRVKVYSCMKKSTSHP